MNRMPSPLRAVAALAFLIYLAMMVVWSVTAK